MGGWFEQVEVVVSEAEERHPNLEQCTLVRWGDTVAVVIHSSPEEDHGAVGRLKVVYPFLFLCSIVSLVDFVFWFTRCG